LALSKSQLQKLYFKAGANWVDRIDVFGRGPVKLEHVVLADKKRFAKFLKVYSLLRYHKPDERELVRKWLSTKGSLAEATKSLTGEGIDKLADQLKQATNQHRELSLISKLAAFANPTSFIAYDQYAQKGARIILRKKPPSVKYTKYVEYLTDVNLIRRSDIGIQIKLYVKTLPLPTRNRKAFAMRMLDFHLMEGGKKANKD
jgi:hypothetical protein